jgi:hypothetical protein
MSNAKLQRVKVSLIQFVRDTISSRYRYCNEFDMWSYTAIKEGYVEKFREEFSEYMNVEGVDVEDMLHFAGRNLGFAIQTYTNITPNYTLEKLLVFAEAFVYNQLDDFCNWCHEVCLAVPENEEEVQEAIDQGDNPS